MRSFTIELILDPNLSKVERNKGMSHLIYFLTNYWNEKHCFHLNNRRYFHEFLYRRKSQISKYEPNLGLCEASSIPRVLSIWWLHEIHRYRIHFWRFFRFDLCCKRSQDPLRNRLKECLNCIRILKYWLYPIGICIHLPLLD